MPGIPTSIGPLHVEVTGSGPPALLWHSFFVDSRTWNRVVPELAADRTLLLVDGPGFGRSAPMTRPLTLDDCAAAASEVIDHLGFGAVDWVGNAWGGHVGLCFGALHPDRLRSLVAIGAPVHRLGARGGTERLRVALLRPVVRVLGFPGPLAGAVTGALLGDRVRRDDPDAVATVVDGMRRPGRRSFDLALRSFVLGRPDLTARALSLAVPVLFVAGGDRGEWTPEAAGAVTDRMRRARTVALRDVRGIAPLEDPAGVVGLVREFWRETAR